MFRTIDIVTLQVHWWSQAQLNHLFLKGKHTLVVEKNITRCQDQTCLGLRCFPSWASHGTAETTSTCGSRSGLFGGSTHQNQTEPNQRSCCWERLEDIVEGLNMLKIGEGKVYSERKKHAWNSKTALSIDSLLAMLRSKNTLETIWMQRSPQSPRLADVTSPQKMTLAKHVKVSKWLPFHLRTPCSTKQVYMNSHSVEHSEFQIGWFWKKNLDNGNVEMTLVMKWGQHQTWHLGLFGTSSKVGGVKNIDMGCTSWEYSQNPCGPCPGYVMSYMLNRNDALLLQFLHTPCLMWVAQLRQLKLRRVTQYPKTPTARHGALKRLSPWCRSHICISRMAHCRRITMHDDDDDDDDDDDGWWYKLSTILRFLYDVLTGVDIQRLWFDALNQATKPQTEQWILAPQ